MNPIFTPPLYRQRHQFVVDFIKKNKPKKVIDLGCNDCSLLRRLKFHREIEFLTGVDIDSAVIRAIMHALAPIPCDYLQPGDHPLTIKLFQGSVTQRDPRTKGFDLVTSIELIEHLPLEDVDRFTRVVFGYMAPVSAIISTPNADFNHLLPRLTGFRHPEHMFEWTQAEFQTWALEVCREFGYVVEFTGVGQIPGQGESTGFCSQIGVFQRDMPTGDASRLQIDVTEECLPYRLLYDVAYPSLCDNNIFHRTLMNEVLYLAETLRRDWVEKAGRGGEDTEQLEERLERVASQTGGDRECGRGVENIEGQRTASPNEEAYREGRYICIPLSGLWSYPRVRALSGTVQRLKEVLLDDTRVEMTEEGIVMVLANDEEDDDDEDPEYRENIDNAVTGESLDSSVANEDWETELV